MSTEVAMRERWPDLIIRIHGPMVKQPTGRTSLRATARSREPQVFALTLPDVDLIFTRVMKKDFNFTPKVSKMASFLR